MATSSTVRRAFDILDLFVDDKAQLGVSDVASKLGITKSTAHRLLSTMEEAKILAKSRGRPKYCLGGKILQIAHAYISNVDLKTISYPYIKELHSKTGDTISPPITCADRRKKSLRVKRF
jgi:DNA-binding IclR family transcriptional regulator